MMDVAASFVLSRELRSSLMGKMLAFGCLDLISEIKVSADAGLRAHK